MENSSTRKIKYLTANAMFAAIAFVSVVVFRISGIGGFLTMDIKDAIMTVAAMYFGPFSAILLSVAVSLIELTVSGTGIYGLIMNILGSVAFTFTASLIYKYKKTFLGAIAGLISGCFVMVACMLLANLFITPYYMGMSASDVAGMIPTLLLPFNVAKGVLNAAITLLLYKPISRVLRRFGFGKTPVSSGKEHDPNKNHNRSVAVFVVSIIIIAAALYIILTVLGGNAIFFGTLK